MIRIGIYQGRLTDSKVLQKYPKNWIKEFKIAKKIGYDHIEIFLEEKKNMNNPFWKKNTKLINSLNKMNNKKLIICDNFIIRNSILKKKNFEYVKKIIDIASNYPNPKIILPLAKINIKKFKDIVTSIAKILKYGKLNKTQISFECNFNYKFIIKINKILDNKFKITFDTGNIYLINKDINFEFKKLKKFINHIHLKDRNAKGKNVQLGYGLINFKSFLKNLKNTNYKGDITLETHRGKKAIRTGYENLNFIKNLL